MTAQLRSFDEFREYSLWYLHDVGLAIPEILNQEFKVVLAPSKTDVVEFGDWAGQPKWRGPADLPRGEWNGRDLLGILANLGAIQGDTEFGSNELQVGLWDSAPSDYDRKVLLSIINEEFRHGWQMGWFETEVLGSDEGRMAAQTLLERRAAEAGNTRILGAFNHLIDDWLGMYSFLEFMDRDGGSQLTLLQHSAVMPLAQSMVFMLREEQKHLRSGQQGFERILGAGKIPVWLVQKYFNVYAPLGYDLHGGERSANALIYYRLGLKGFYPSPDDYLDGPSSAVIDAQLLVDLAHREREKVAYGYKFSDLRLDGPVRDINKELLNAITVSFYKRTLEKHVVEYNEIIKRAYPAGTPLLKLPSLRFNRSQPSIYAGERYDLDGNPVTDERAYQRYLTENLPSAADYALLKELCRRPGWIAPPDADVYKKLTVVKGGDTVLYPTTFGTSRRSRYISCLSRNVVAAPAPVAPIEVPKPKSSDEAFWAFMDREAD